MQEKMLVQEETARERDGKMEQKLERRPWRQGFARRSAVRAGVLRRRRRGARQTHCGAVGQARRESKRCLLSSRSRSCGPRWRARRLRGARPTEVSSPRFHRYLTARFGSFPEAASHTRALQGRCYDRSGGAVDVIHKGAQLGRPPQVNRGGAALAPVSKARPDVGAETLTHCPPRHEVPCGAGGRGLRAGARHARGGRRWREGGPEGGEELRQRGAD